jgi:hypothetical protein
MSLGKLKIRDELGRVTECSLDGYDLTRHLTGIRFKAEVDECTKVTLEMILDVDYEGEPHVEAIDPRARSIWSRVWTLLNRKVW